MGKSFALLPGCHIVQPRRARSARSTTSSSGGYVATHAADVDLRLPDEGQLHLRDRGRLVRHDRPDGAARRSAPGSGTADGGGATRDRPARSRRRGDRRLPRSGDAVAAPRAPSASRPARRAERRQRAAGAVRLAREADAPPVPDQLVADRGSSCPAGSPASGPARCPSGRSCASGRGASTAAGRGCRRRRPRRCRTRCRARRSRSCARRPAACVSSASVRGTSPPKRASSAGRRALEALGLLAEEAGAADDLLQRRQRRLRHRLRRRVAPEQLGRHHVDPLVRALGGQDRRAHQLERRLAVELAVDVGVQLLERRRRSSARAPDRAATAPRRGRARRLGDQLRLADDLRTIFRMSPAHARRL